eukprot:CCRYP_020335-RA/>CCRYP_020335-RA protein AED:0.23 eAED:0.30 QI:0/0/0/1/0/0/3/0/559
MGTRSGSGTTIIWKTYSYTENLLKRVQGFMREAMRVAGEADKHGNHQATKDVAKGNLCTVEKLQQGAVKILSHTAPPKHAPTPKKFLEVLKEWGGLWLWKELQLANSSGSGVHSKPSDYGDWIRQAIEEKTLMGVTDGSYIRELCPKLCSAALIFECKKGKGRLVLALGERSEHANADRGELLCLMALHLLILSFNRTWPNLKGKVEVVSDCMVALHKVETLPPGKIPSSCCHSDILKNIMLHCSNLTFHRKFSHVKAHQGDHKVFDKLLRKAQLNSGCDYGATSKLMRMALEDLPNQQAFPLEAVLILIEGQKLSTESSSTIRFYAQLHRRQGQFLQKGKYCNPMILFQVFACKQVFDEAATFKNLHKRKDPSVSLTICPFCTQSRETSGHILSCPEQGIVKLLKKYSKEVMDWLLEADVPRELVFLLGAVIQGRGEVTMKELCQRLPCKYRKLAMAQDKIGWRRFLEGMVAIEFSLLINRGLEGRGNALNSKKLVLGLIQRLLEITHSMWIYRNLLVHDLVAGKFACKRKDKLLEDIEEQLAQGKRDSARKINGCWR